MARRAGDGDEGLVGQVVGGCRLERLLGRGGMSAAHAGLHLGLQIPVVVKTLDPKRAWGRQGLVEAFLREGKALAAVNHPHVVRVLSAGTEGRLPYLVLERVPGGSLRARLRAGRLGPPEAAARVADAAHGLAAAHAAGIVHGDVKPENILLDAEGRAKVVDFGLARAAGEEVGAEGAVLHGTPAYMAPELARGAAPTPAADVYALGVLLFELLLDRWPFNAPSPALLLRKHAVEEPPLGELEEVGAPPDMLDLLARCLEKSPDQRPADAAAVALALEEIDFDAPPRARRRRRGRGGRSSATHRASPGRPARPRARRPAATRTGGGGGAGGLVIALGVLLAIGAAVAALVLLTRG